MKNYILFLTFLLTAAVSMAQEPDKVLGVVINSADDSVLESVNIVNLNQVIGTSTDKKGEFNISQNPSAVARC